jgi:hypothetical protein
MRDHMQVELVSSALTMAIRQHPSRGPARYYRLHSAIEPDSIGRLVSEIKWLGREGSNLRMAESKSAALPLGYAPTGWAGTAPVRHPGPGTEGL